MLEQFMNMALRPAVALRRGFRVLPLLLVICLALPKAGFAEALRYGNVEADKQAEYIDMGEGQIEDWETFYEYLDLFPMLRKVDLFATEINSKRIEEMTGRFPQITFGMTMKIGDHVLRTDATAFSTLHTPNSYMHDETELSLVRFCTNLYALDLGHNRLSDLSFLCDLPELRVLIIAMNIPLSDITPVGSLRHLEYLEMFNNCISDISCLSGLPFLMDLNLCTNDISNLEPVKNIAGLKRLWMSRFRRGVPFGEVRKEALLIRKALPECEVDEYSPGVEGNWRKHPHYDVISRIFNTGEYEPFEDSPAENIPALYR